MALLKMNAKQRMSLHILFELLAKWYEHKIDKAANKDKV